MTTISDASIDRYYYIFDSRERRAVVMDRTTGAEYDWDGEARVQLLRHVRDRLSDTGAAPLRQFAAWCAQRTGADTASSTTADYQLWTAAQELAAGTARDASRAEAARQDTHDEALMALTVGLPHGDTEAARLLTVQACTHADPVDAASDAAHMSERWAELSSPETPTAAARSMREDQVNWLLDTLLDA